MTKRTGSSRDMIPLAYPDNKSLAQMGLSGQLAFNRAAKTASTAIAATKNTITTKKRTP